MYIYILYIFIIFIFITFLVGCVSELGSYQISQDFGKLKYLRFAPQCVLNCWSAVPHFTNTGRIPFHKHRPYPISQTQAVSHFTNTGRIPFHKHRPYTISQTQAISSNTKYPYSNCTNLTVLPGIKIDMMIRSQNMEIKCIIN